MTYEEVLHEVFEKVYRNTDDCEMRISKECYKLIVKALEKQIPKKPTKVDKLLDKELWKAGWQYRCPICKCCCGENRFHFEVTVDEGYCMQCGQNLDWSEVK